MTFDQVAAGATALGVLIAAWQLYSSSQQERSQFEDRLTEQYRAVASRLPLEALLGEPLSMPDLEASLRAFYDYFDLSNEQAFLYKHGRVRRSTWSNWLEGIEQHMERPAFRQAWHLLSPRLAGSFDDLRAYIRETELQVQ